MPAKRMFALAALMVSNAGAYRADRKAVAEAVAKVKGGLTADAQTNSALLETASSFLREHEGALLRVSSLSRFTVGNTSSEDFLKSMTNAVGAMPSDPSSMTPEEVERVTAKMQAAFKKIGNIPASDPFWTQLRAGIKKMMMDSSQDARDWINWAAEKKYDLYVHKSCNFFGGADLAKEPSTGKMWPTDAYWCGHPGIDWSGSIYNGKPINDYCGASVGDSQSQKLCGKYSDKEIVVGLLVTNNEDPRDVNVMMSDCLMDIIDADVYYCHKCAGRCSGQYP